MSDSSDPGSKPPFEPDYDYGDGHHSPTSHPNSLDDGDVGVNFTDDTKRGSTTDSAKKNRTPIVNLLKRKKRQDRRRSTLRGNSTRKEYLKVLHIKQKIQSSLYSSASPGGMDQVEIGSSEHSAVFSDGESVDSLYEAVKQEVKDNTKESSKMQAMTDIMNEYSTTFGVTALQFPLEVRMNAVSYRAPVSKTNKIKTVYNSSNVYRILKFFKRTCGSERGHEDTSWKYILRDIDLVFKPGKMYLILGPPASGKSTLLKAISAQLEVGKNEIMEGSITYNGRTLMGDSEFFIENAFAYIDQLDKHAPRLTVDETFEFAFQCKSGGTIIPEKEWLDTEELREAIKRADCERVKVNLILQSLGLSEVRDTFVGNSSVRGVSGGQRRRVTVGEMLMNRTPLLCGDEISTGLDASSTYDIVQLLLHFGRHARMSRIFSLLQPSPETVSLFDEVILMGDGMILYAGPIVEVEDYFAEIGYRSPEFMDVGDFLQMVSCEEGISLYDPPPAIRAERPEAPSVSELAQIFRASSFGKGIQLDISAPNEYLWNSEDGNSGKNSAVSNLSHTKAVKQRYMNSFFRNAHLIFDRFIVLWLRDKRVIIAGAVKNILMGVSVGGVFMNVEDPFSILGALFQAMLFIMLGAIQSASSLVDDRVIFHKHAKANFYSSWPYIFARTVASLPQTIIDVCMFGTILFFMVGLGDREVVNFFIYLAILITFAVVMNQQLAIFATFSTSSQLQAYSAVLLLFLVLFGGFIVAPDAIPSFYDWIYWWNPFAWAYRALVVNEFRSIQGVDPDELLVSLGFIDNNGEPFQQQWVAFGFLYLCPYYLLCTVIAALLLGCSKDESKPSNSASTAEGGALRDVEDELGANERTEIEFKPVTLSFHDISYDVQASTSNDILRLLKNVNGIFRPGRMCCLMGSSGAGKTTLMDVIALRKRTGTISGEVRLNGWVQDPIAFRRCSGYVEQFDVQTPELTVRETITFSAKLRLDPDVLKTSEDVKLFVSRIMNDVELMKMGDVLVGSDEDEGLSFEQKKRLSIAVELAASPSVIFLDEPTSGLDARSAMLIVKTLRRISDKGRTICATIHQPSSAVFGMFDDLLLLKKGGEVVYHGELGDINRDKLVSYFESNGAPEIALGDNPANWMLRVMSSDDVGDLAAVYRESNNFSELRDELAIIASESPADGTKISYDTEFATGWWVRIELVKRRLRTIYWRSPAYNLSRLVVSSVIALVLGSIFIRKRNQQQFSEIEIQSRFSVVFLSFIIVGIMAILSVLPVMTKIRDMFYRHRDAGMYSSTALAYGLGSAEMPFIVLSSAIFCCVFLGVSGMNVKVNLKGEVKSLIAFWGFFTFNIAIYSYFGQAFVSSVKPLSTAVILSSVFIGLNNFFAGLIARPQIMVGTFFAVPYYITPGHYVYEGLIVSLFAEDPREVIADDNSEFYFWLVDNGDCDDTSQSPCIGSVADYMSFFFGGQFDVDHVRRDTLILGGVLTLTRILTFLALKYIRFS